MDLRRPQAEFQKIGREVSSTRIKRCVIGDITPGGGKTACGSIYFKELFENSVAKKAIWLCPRKSLVSQVREAFERWSGLSEAKYLSAYHYGNLELSYLINLCKAHPTLLICDELQFLADYQDSGKWSRDAQILMESCAQFVGLSGTLHRSGSGRLLGVTYKLGSEFSGSEYRSNLEYPCADVQYSLRHALEDEVVAPFHIPEFEGRLEIKDEGRWIDIHSPEADEYRAALKPFLLNPSIWKKVVDDCVESWIHYRNHHYRSKAIFVAASQDHAKEICSHLKKRHRIAASLAISENDDSAENIEIFKSRVFDSKARALVTVGMASVGLDVPDATHMAYLSNYRFSGWMLQAWARVSRICYDCGISPSHQVAHIHTIRDPRMDRFIKWVKEQTPKGVSVDDRGGEGPAPPSSEESSIFGEAEITGISFETSDVSAGYTGGVATAIQNAITAIPILRTVPAKVVEELMSRVDLSSIAPLEKKESQPSLDNVGGTHKHKVTAIKRIIQVGLSRLANEEGEDHAIARNKLYETIGAEGLSIDDIVRMPHDSRGNLPLVEMLCNLCEELEDRKFNKLTYKLKVDRSWSQEKVDGKVNKIRESIITMNDILSEYGRDIEVVLRQEYTQ